DGNRISADDDLRKLDLQLGLAARAARRDCLHHLSINRRALSCDHHTVGEEVGSQGERKYHAGFRVAGIERVDHLDQEGGSPRNGDHIGGCGSGSDRDEVQRRDLLGQKGVRNSVLRGKLNSFRISAEKLAVEDLAILKPNRIGQGRPGQPEAEKTEHQSFPSHPDSFPAASCPIPATRWFCYCAELPRTKRRAWEPLG